jgi:hypothetical protein
MMTRLSLVAMAVVAQFALPAYADLTVKSQDGALELAVPNGWHEVTPEGAATKLVATDGHGARVMVRVYSKEDFKDLKSVANFTATGFKLEDSQPKTEDVQLNGKPAVSMNLTGTEPSGLRLGLVITVFEAEGVYVDVIGRAPASAFTKQAPVLAGMAKGLKITPVAAAATPAPAPAAAPQTPPRH